MCGIAGGWLHRGIDPKDVRSSLDAMRHRGPDDHGQYVERNAFLGMRRLSIIDLDGGRQPIYSEDGSVVVVCNGEIYNYIELREELRRKGHRFSTGSDTEVLVHLYEEVGEELAKELSGMFAYAILDRRRRRIVLGRDRFGKKPLYYVSSGAGLVFASELKALEPLARAAGNRWSVRPQAIYDYLSLGVVPQPDTVYEDVRAVPPASYVQYDGTSERVTTYWELEYRPKVSISREAAVAGVRQRIRSAVEMRLRSDVPIGVFLSGGLDSSVVAYEAAQLVGSSLQTFTVRMGDARLDESEQAGRTARALGVGNVVLPLRVSPLEDLERVVAHYDQPFADSSAIPSMAIASLAKKHVTVVLNGDGGDEVFAGYRRYVAAAFAGALRLPGIFASRAIEDGVARLGAGRRSHAGFLARLLRGLSLSPAGRYLAWTTDMLREEDKAQHWLGDRMHPTEEMVAKVLPPGLSALDTQLAGDIRLNLLSDLLVKMDMATMAASLETRSPLLDHHVAEYVARLPTRRRFQGGQLKGILRQAYADVLPLEVIKGKKRGFEIPLAQWLSNELHSVVHDLLGSPNARVRDWLDGKFVDDLLAKRTFLERNWCATVYALLVFELWDRGRSSRSVTCHSA